MAKSYWATMHLPSHFHGPACNTYWIQQHCLHPLSQRGKTFLADVPQASHTSSPNATLISSSCLLSSSAFYFLPCTPCPISFCLPYPSSCCLSPPPVFSHTLPVSYVACVLQVDHSCSLCFWLTARKNEAHIKTPFYSFFLTEKFKSLNWNPLYYPSYLLISRGQERACCFGRRVGAIQLCYGQGSFHYGYGKDKNVHQLVHITDLKRAS